MATTNVSRNDVVEHKISVSCGLQEQWQALRTALDDVAVRHMNIAEFPLPPDYAHWLPRADAELARALLSVDAKEVHGQFVQDGARKLSIVLAIL